jgi:hypothetical protein
MVGVCSPVSPASRTADASTATTPIGGRLGHPVQATSRLVECIAMLGGRRSTGFRAPAGEQRRYLVDEALYDIGAFGFVIDEARDRQYTGPSSFIGWAEP